MQYAIRGYRRALKGFAQKKEKVGRRERKTVEHVSFSFSLKKERGPKIRQKNLVKDEENNVKGYRPLPLTIITI